MKKIFLPALLLLSTIIYSQELDKTFLESLPDSVRQDIEGKIDAKADLEKPIYRRASTFVDKDKDDDKTKLFGSDFFDVMQTTFMPINEPNLDASYHLYFGDVL